MARCEDFPCCGHERGCCPDYDENTGQQLNMICVCGAKLPITARYSICDSCMRDPDDPNSLLHEGYDPPESEYDEPDLEEEDDV